MKWKRKKAKEQSNKKEKHIKHNNLKWELGKG